MDWVVKMRSPIAQETRPRPSTSAERFQGRWITPLAMQRALAVSSMPQTTQPSSQVQYTPELRTRSDTR